MRIRVNIVRPTLMAEEITRLTDFKPLRYVRLPELGELDCSGLIMLVGPNSSGKSQLLQDIYHRVAGMPRQLVVADAIEINKPAVLGPFLQALETDGYFKTVEDEAGTKQLRPLTMYLGSGQALAQIQPQQAEQMYGRFSPDSGQSARQAIPFLNHFGRLLVTALFLDRRLTSLTAVGVIDFLTQSPQHDLHALYLDDDARERLHEEMLSSFGRAVWPDMSQGNRMSLKVSDADVLPTAEDRLSHKKMAEFRSIESEGDGMKSYVATCVALLLGRRPVCLVDEPEMCLHPPQAYNLGRFIGRYGAGRDTMTVVATHSSHLLRGVLQTAEHVQIVRLNRRDRKFSAHLVPAVNLTEALERPTLKAEAVLDGIFAQAVAVVEADGDRLVYQAVWETVQPDFKIDLHFATVGGTGGIADIDMLVDSDKMRKVLTRLVEDAAVRDALITECEQVAGSVRTMPSTLSAGQVSSQLQALSKYGMNWEKDEDLPLQKAIRNLANQIDRTRRLKGGGLRAYQDGPIGPQMASLLERLAQLGVFLVPVGELEQWLDTHAVGVSTSDKRAWANAAAQKVQTLGRQPGDVWEFVKSVGAFLAK